MPTYTGAHQTWLTRSDNGTTTQSVSYTNYPYDDDVKVGVDNPKWEEQVSQLKEAGTSYVRQSTQVYPKPEYVWMKEVHPTVTYTKVAEGMRWRSASHGKGILLSISPSDNARAEGNFLQNASDALSPFKALPFLGEIRETLRLIKGRSLDLFSLITAYERQARRIRRALARERALKTIRDLYLEAQFGWKPILSDVKAATLALKRVEKDVKLWSATGKASTTSRVVVPPLVIGSQYGYWYGRYLRTNVTSVKYVGQVKVTVSRSGGSPDALIEACGFRLAEFVPSLWELLPWSWAFDYFTNAGGIVNAAFFDHSKLVWCSKTEYQRSVQTSSWEFDYGLTKRYYPMLTEWSARPGEFRTEHFSYRRSVAQPGVPSLVLELPLSGWKYANLLAALSTLSKGR